MVFSDTAGNTGILQRVRIMARVDENQWPTVRVVNSANDWHDKVVGYLIGADKRFQWDDTNHTKLPEGTTNLVSGQSDYSFLTDEQGNKILTLLGISALPSSTATYYEQLKEVDRQASDYNIETFGMVSGKPTGYDKIADNIIRLDHKPSESITSGLKFSFQRAGSYFAVSDTTKEPGVSPLLHRGYVIAGAYDVALTLGLKNLQALSVELAKEEDKLVKYCASRNNDFKKVMTPKLTRFI